MSMGIFNNISNLRKSLCSVSIRINHFRQNHSESLKYVFNMNEAYLRYERGDQNFHFTFRYVNTDFNVDRQFNLMRRPMETVGNFLQRIDYNINKILSKKKKKKLKKLNIQDEIKMIDNVELGNIELLRGHKKINLNETCETFLKNVSNITLKLFGVPYKVRMNVPWVLNVTLPECILAKFPTYPAEFETQYMDKSMSKFTWYINSSEATQNSLIYKASWVEIGHGFLYTPTIADINSRLKLEIVPVNGKEIGPMIEAESINEIQAGPGPCPFETRHAFTREKLSGKDFRVTSYNILADIYASTEFSRDVLFPYCPSYALAINYRKQFIIKELIGYNSDIICLQEVDQKIFQNDLHPLLSLLGYDGVFNRKGDDLSEGIAIFYNKNRFKKVSSESRVMSQNIEMKEFFQAWKKITNDTVKARFLARSTTILVTVLKSKENPNEILVVGNTHLYFQPDADHIRLLQGFYALTYCQEFAKRISKESGANVNVILCGDFNSTPDCGIYQLMTTNHVPEDHKDWSSNDKEKVENVSLSHESSFASACGTPQYTNFTVEFSGCLDYIFYETKNLSVTQIVPMPSYEELSLHKAIPSVVCPSDHIALCVDLKWIR